MKIILTIKSICYLNFLLMTDLCEFICTLAYYYLNHVMPMSWLIGFKNGTNLIYQCENLIESFQLFNPTPSLNWPIMVSLEEGRYIQWSLVIFDWVVKFIWEIREAVWVIWKSMWSLNQKTWVAVLVLALLTLLAGFFMGEMGIIFILLISQDSC